jgi:hypothetical protein
VGSNPTPSALQSRLRGDRQAGCPRLNPAASECGWHPIDIRDARRYPLPSSPADAHKKMRLRPSHSGTLGEGMRAAIEEIEGGFRQMIEGWERQ